MHVAYVINIYTVSVREVDRARGMLRYPSALAPRLHATCSDDVLAGRLAYVRRSGWSVGEEGGRREGENYGTLVALARSPCFVVCIKLIFFRRERKVSVKLSK